MKFNSYIAQIARGGYSWEFLVGMCRPVLQILTLFQTKKCYFPHPFSVQTSKNPHPFSDLACRKKLCQEGKRKNSTNPLRIRTFLFLSYSFGIETINTFIHSRRSLENHTRFQTNMSKSYTRFQTKKAQKSYADGAAHTYIAYIRGYTRDQIAA